MLGPWKSVKVDGCKKSCMLNEHMIEMMCFDPSLSVDI